MVLRELGKTGLRAIEKNPEENFGVLLIFVEHQMKVGSHGDVVEAAPDGDFIWVGNLGAVAVDI